MGERVNNSFLLDFLGAADGTLPNYRDSPTYLLKFGCRFEIALSIRGDFVFPELSPRARQPEKLTVMTVEEASSNINQRPVSAKDDIRGPG
ncbi:hypothetical protein NBRC116589_17650 [Ruegeria sp. HU-ET01832]